MPCVTEMTSSDSCGKPPCTGPPGGGAVAVLTWCAIFDRDLETQKRCKSWQLLSQMRRLISGSPAGFPPQKKTTPGLQEFKTSQQLGAFDLRKKGSSLSSHVHMLVWSSPSHGRSSRIEAGHLQFQGTGP